MPALHHLQPRADLDIGISATAIGLIVGFGIIPVIIIIWVVIFLFFAYPYDRNWCCMKRKKHKDNIPDVPDQVSSQESFSNEKMHYGGAPKRPYAAQVRTDSGESSYSNNNARLTKERPSASHARYDTRMSLQSVGSAQGVSQEPKPFV